MYTSPDFLTQPGLRRVLDAVIVVAILAENLAGGRVNKMVLPAR